MSRPKTWLAEAHSIYKTVQQTEEDRRFNWRDLAALFGLGRRAAYNILSRLNPQKNESGASTVSRAHLLEWLEPQKRTVEQRLEATRLLLAVLRAQELEEQASRQAFLEKLQTEALNWTLTPTLAGTTISTLPENVKLGPGKIEIDFLAGHPIDAAVALYALGMALLNDWPRFAAATAPQSAR